MMIHDKKFSESTTVCIYIPYTHTRTYTHLT